MTDPEPRIERGVATSLTLLDRLRSNEQEAWSRTMQLYRPLVVSWCRRGGVSTEDAEDVAQEVFRGVASTLSSFRRDRPDDTFRGWLRGLARHKTLDWHRYRGRQPIGAVGGTEAGIALGQVADVDLGEDDPAETSALYHRALELVRGEFEPSTWQAFWRVAVDGATPSEVAQTFGITPAAVRQAKSRVLRRLKEEIGDLIA